MLAWINADRNPACKPLDWCPILYKASLIIAYTGSRNLSVGLINMWT
jgi:hypothetical protein